MGAQRSSHAATPVRSVEVERIAPRPALSFVETEQGHVNEAGRLVELALDLHDGPLQDIAVLEGNMCLLRDQLRSVVAEAEARERLLAVVDTAARAIRMLDEDLRNLAWSMRVDRVLGQPFDEALASELLDFETETGIETQFRVRGSVGDLPPAVQATLLQVMREVLANVERHSGAGVVRVRLERTPRHVRLDVWDDGDGFDVAEALGAATSRGRLGTLGMCERMRLIGGSLELASTPGEGTLVTASVPLLRQR